MAVAYTTAQLDTIIAALEAGLGAGYAEVMYENRRMVYRSAADIRSAIAYFASRYSTATDADPDAPPKTRTFLFFGGNGVGY